MLLHLGSLDSAFFIKYLPYAPSNDRLMANFQLEEYVEWAVIYFLVLSQNLSEETDKSSKFLRYYNLLSDRDSNPMPTP
jgi:hypothetical protein